MRTADIRPWLRLAAVASALGVPIAPAEALEPRQLAGWWLGIDDTFPKLWERRAIVPMEELLIVGADGRVEDRVMNFWAGSAKTCAESKVCGDAPVVASARIEIRRGKLTFAARHPGGGRLDAARGDGAIRAAVITATADWTATLKGGLLTLRGGRKDAPRYFARIDPERLRRLRAGMRVSALAPGKHWRCLLANATAQDGAFAPLRAMHVTGEARPTASPLLPRYLKVASYVAALDAALSVPTPDDANAKDLIGFGTEEVMMESFDDVRAPASLADKENLLSRMKAVEARVAAAAEAQKAKERNTEHTPDDGADANKAAKETAPPPPTEKPVKLPLPEADLAAFAKILTDPAETARVFCKD